MTHQIDSDLLTTVLQLLTDEGSFGFAEGLRLLVNEAMIQERAAALQARSNGFKPRDPRHPRRRNRIPRPSGPRWRGLLSQRSRKRRPQ